MVSFRRGGVNGGVAVYHWKHFLLKVKPESDLFLSLLPPHHHHHPPTPTQPVSQTDSPCDYVCVCVCVLVSSANVSSRELVPSASTALCSALHSYRRTNQTVRSCCSSARRTHLRAQDDLDQRCKQAGTSQSLSPVTHYQSPEPQLDVNRK